LFFGGDDDDAHAWGVQISSSILCKAVWFHAVELPSQSQIKTAGDLVQLISII
jgi:hypothetical protein